MLSMPLYVSTIFSVSHHLYADDTQISHNLYVNDTQRYLEPLSRSFGSSITEFADNLGAVQVWVGNTEARHW